MHRTTSMMGARAAARAAKLYGTAALAAVGLVGCAGGSDDAAGPTYYRDVKGITDAHCVSCHTTGGIAPFALTSYDAVAAVRARVRDAVTTRIMPPWLAGDGCATYRDDPALSQQQIETIARWVDAGAPAGDPADRPADPPPPPPSLSRVDRTLTMPAAYTPRVQPDDYRCFLLDWPETQKVYVTGFRADPGNASIVHHVIAFVIPPAEVAQYEQLDAAEDGPGYTCFGGPGGGAVPVSWIGGWAPGSRSGDFPAGTGLPIEPGSKIALQMHYNTVNGLGVDQTSIDVRIEPTVTKEAKLQFWTNPNWVLEQAMPIAAGDPSVSYSFAADPTPYVSNGQPFAVYSAMYHQHLRGKSGRLHIEHADGTDECMLDIPRWDFHWQLTYRFEQPKIVRPGDKLAIDCTWDNSAENQPIVDGTRAQPQTLNWGEGTNDEMCLGAFYIAQP